MSVVSPIKLLFTIPTSNETTITIRPVVFPENTTISYNWGDLTNTNTTTYSSTDLSFNLLTKSYKSSTTISSGYYTVTISPNLTNDGIQRQITSFTITSGPQYLTKCFDFGTVGLTSLDGTFNGATNLVSVPSNLPSTVTSLNNTFNGCKFFNDSNVSGWDTSGVKSMIGTFSGCSVFNKALNWNTSKVTDMSYMFYGASSFNQPLKFDTSNVTNMAYMFYNAASFNQSLDPSGNTWNTSKVTSMGSMFNGTNSFSRDSLKNWIISSIKPPQQQRGSTLATSMVNMLCNTGLTNTYYNNLIIAWNNQATSNNDQGPYNVTLCQTGLTTTTDEGGKALTNLQNTFKWTIKNTASPS
jgi:surface protein